MRQIMVIRFCNMRKVDYNDMQITSKIKSPYNNTLQTMHFEFIFTTGT